MMHWIHILAQRGDDDGNWTKIVFGVIVVLFWLISAFATWLNKRQEEQRRRRLREQVNRGPEPVSPPQRPAPVRRPPPTLPRPGEVIVGVPRPAPPRPAPPRQVQRQVQRQAPRPPQRPIPKPPRQPAHRARATAPPVSAAPITAAATELTTLPVTATEISATEGGAAAARPSASAVSIARWLRPETLRQQFILTEILQPPLSLRESLHR